MPYAIRVRNTAEPGTPAFRLAGGCHPYWVRACEWVAGTASPTVDGRPPRDLLVWDEREDAERFAAEWKGHPWWIRDHDSEVVEVQEVTELVRVGWAVCREGEE